MKRIGNRLRYRTGLSIKQDVSRSMAVVMEYITAEILEFAGKELKKGRSNINPSNLITVKLIKNGLNADP